MKRVSIKLRVTLWYGLVMILTVAVILSFMFALSGTLAQTETHRRLLQMVERNARKMEFEDGVLEIDSGFIAYSNGIYTLVYAEDGALLAGRLPPGVELDVPFTDGQLRRIQAGGVAYDVYDQRVVYKGHPALRIRGVLQVDEVGETGPLLRAGLFALPLLAALSIGIGYLITRHAFRPIEDIRKTAREIGGGQDLSLRIALGEGRDELHLLAGTFNHMLARLETSFETEKRFVSDASHELRTPTAVILAQCDDALAQPGSAEDLREALLVVRRQAGKLSHLIAQMLTFTRLERGMEAAQMERLNMSELLASLCEEMGLLHPGLQADIQPEVYALADRDLLTRLAVNLLQNAFRYGKPGGRARVVLRREGAAGGLKLAALTVEDDGIGIAPEHLPNIWNRFYQVNPSRSGGGAGLGLAMCRQIAVLHGGKITAKSELGRGSVFRFELPAL